ncbi:MAG: lysylphosphatidylglycerol synthase transmembrane domain-containing protein [Pseudomonadota bacterium]|nr:lysylphosphatidylglycerol synthase transmembrane domain-containing protein [Pseudomonadota bacterium]
MADLAFVAFEAVKLLSKTILFLIKAAVTVGLIWFVLRGQDLSALGERLADISPLKVGAAIALLAGQNVIAAQRWIVIMRLFGQALPYRVALRFFFEGLFFNQALPSTVGGDGVRMYRAVKAGLPVAAGVKGVLLDRIAGLFGLLAIVALTQPWLYARVDDISARSAFAVIIVAGVIGVSLLILCRRLPADWVKWRVIRGLIGLSDGVVELFRRADVALPVFGISVVGHLMMVLAIFILARDLNLAITFVDCLVLIPGVMLLSAVPISIAGWGVREAVMVAAMGLLGVTTDGSTSLSLIYGFSMVIIGLIGGMLWFANSDRRVGDLTPLPASANDRKD